MPLDRGNLRSDPPPVLFAEHRLFLVKRTPFPALALNLILGLLCAVTAHGSIGPTLQMQLGNPSNATADSTNRAHFLIQRAQYALDYADTTRQPNWVAWNLTTSDVGGSGRSPDFFVDTTLPTGFYRVLTTDYSGSGYDRGHMCPSADRTATTADNQVTFWMSNIVPQTPDNNQGVWASFETYCRTLAATGNELLIVSGPGGFAGTTLASGVAIPGYTWKVVAVVPLGPGTALSRITAATRVIAIKIPNVAGVRSNPWQQYVTSAAQIETDTGYIFFTALPASVAAALRAKVDEQTTAGIPRIATQPAAQSATLGGTATFTVSATGNAPLTYQWSLDGDEIAGATAATLSLTNIQVAHLGGYSVVVTNALGSITSAAAVLSLGSGSDSGAISWDFSAATPASALPPDVTGGTITQGNNNGTTALLTSVSVASGYAGVSGGNNAGAAARVGALDRTAGTGSAFFEFTFTPASGRQLIVTSLSFGARSTATGPQAFGVFTNLDNFTTPIVTGPLAANSVWTLIAPTFPAFAGVPGSALTIRIYGYAGVGNAGAGTANWRIDDLKLGLGVIANTATPPVITRQPGNITAIAGRTTTLAVVATGTPPPTFQWRKGGVPIPGAIGDTLTLTNVTPAQIGAYSVVVTNSAASITSTTVALTVLRRSYAGSYFGTIGAPAGSGSPSGGSFALWVREDNTGVLLGYERIPAFLGDLPAGGYVDHTRTYLSRKVSVDENGAFNFEATSYIPTSAFRGGVIPNPPVTAPIAPLTVSRATFRGNISDNGTLTGFLGASTLAATKSPDNGPNAAFAGFYLAEVAGGSAETLAIVSSAGQALVVVQTSGTIDAGTGSVDAAGKASVTTFGSQSVAATLDATRSAFSANLTDGQGSTMTFAGFAESSPALAAQRLVNLSTRASAGTGDQVAIVGFVVAGLESKSVLIRGIGPSLRSFGVPTALAAPRLDLMRGSTVIATNTGWGTSGNTAELASAALGSGAFPLAANSADCAILTTLAPGNYTAVVTASDGRAGVTLVEVYDRSGGSNLQRLVNVSTRASTGTGDNTLIAGLVVSGTAPKRVLIRAAGPSLATFGVPTVLARPQLTLFSGSTVIAQNAGWSASADTAAIAEAALRVGAFAFASTSADSAILINLAPGAYTAQVTSVDGATGTALVEVYELP